MATSAVPALIDALVAAAKTALEPEVIVYDGMDVSDDPGDFLMIGVDDPDSDALSNSAESEQEWATVGQDLSRNERGTITCAALSWTGESKRGAQKIVRDRAYAITAKVEDILRADPKLGVPTLLWTEFGGNSNLLQGQDQQGAQALIVFQIGFRAFI